MGSELPSSLSCRRIARGRLSKERSLESPAGLDLVSILSLTQPPATVHACWVTAHPSVMYKRPQGLRQKDLCERETVTSLGPDNGTRQWDWGAVSVGTVKVEKVQLA